MRVIVLDAYGQMLPEVFPVRLPLVKLMRRAIVDSSLGRKPER
jgi:hypothetical protein